jgi:hypothetical protein
MRFILILALAVGLSGCANFRYAYDKLTSVQVTPQSVSIAGSTFDALVPIATNYLRLQKCTSNNGPLCRDPVVAAKIIKAVRSGRVARNTLEQFFIDHPGTLGPSGLYDAFQASITTLQSILK